MPTFLLVVYRASFPMTFKEIRAGPGHYRIVIPAVAVGVAIGYFVSEFLKNTGEFLCRPQGVICLYLNLDKQDTPWLVRVQSTKWMKQISCLATIKGILTCHSTQLIKNGGGF